MNKNFKEVIWHELLIWQKAFPKCADVLKKFATKIKLEIELQTKLGEDLKEAEA